MRYRVDSSWRRVGDRGEIVIAGSPLRLLRLSARGAAVAEAIERSEPVPTSTLTERLTDAGAIHPIRGGRPALSVDDVTIVTPQLGGTVLADGRVTVDDGSAPPLEGATVRIETNRGPATARNVGRAEVGTQIVAFVDADVDLPSSLETRHGADATQWWSRLLGHFDDPRVGLVAPRVLGGRDTSLDLGSEPARIRSGTRVSYVPAAMILVRVAAFDDVGGFDERLRFGEDVDFVWRLDEAGWRCRYEPGSTVWHRPRPTLFGRMRQQFGYGSSSAPLGIRHPRALAPYRSDGWTAFGWLLLAAGRFASAGVVVAANTIRAVVKLPGVPTSTAVRLVMTGHAAAGGALARAVRRVWWPLLLPACVFSRRVRIIMLASVAASPRTVVGDVSFGAGVWVGMVRHRTWRPIAPQLIRHLTRTRDRGSIR